MKKHGHKEPPLQNKVNHRKRLVVNTFYYVSMGLFTLAIAFTFASVFDA